MNGKSRGPKDPIEGAAAAAIQQASAAQKASTVIADFQGEVRVVDGTAKEMLDEVQRLSKAANDEIDVVIRELNEVRTFLQAESERVQRTVSNYADICRAAGASMPVVPSSLAELQAALVKTEEVIATTTEDVLAAAAAVKSVAAAEDKSVTPAEDKPPAAAEEPPVSAAEDKPLAPPAEDPPAGAVEDETAGAHAAEAHAPDTPEGEPVSAEGEPVSAGEHSPTGTGEDKPADTAKARPRAKRGGTSEQSDESE